MGVRLLLLHNLRSLVNLTILKHLNEVHTLCASDSYVNDLTLCSLKAIALEECASSTEYVDCVATIVSKAQIYALNKWVRLNREAKLSIDCIDCVSLRGNLNNLLYSLLSLAPAVLQLQGYILLTRSSIGNDSCLISR